MCEGIRESEGAFLDIGGDKIKKSRRFRLYEREKCMKG
jgi:hypothetical protein